MSEYWKSQGKRYCDACKCYFADNKASIQHHEQGKKHKENVAKRIDDIAKRGAKEYKEKQAYEKQMAKIEAAALAAMGESTGGVEDRKQLEAVKERKEESQRQSYYEAAQSKQFEKKAEKRAPPPPPADIRTPDESVGIAGGWVTVAVRDLPVKEDPEDVKPELPEDIPLPPPEKKKRFQEKVVSLNSGAGDEESDEKVVFGFKKKGIRKGNIRQRTDE